MRQSPTDPSVLSTHDKNPSYVPAMSVLSSVPSSANNPILADALARAQALAIAKPATKRPSDESYEGPDLKKPFHQPNMMPVFPPGGPGISTEEVMVPDNMVGLIFGEAENG